MKIQLGNNSVFEPNNRTIKSYFIGCGLIIVTLGILRFDLIWYPVFIGMETLILIWAETKYYPYGVKPEDMRIKTVDEK
jgi:hypothetical protein